MGQRTIIPDEVIEVIEEVLEPETVLPTFAEELQQSTVNLDEASSWVLPEVILGSAALGNVVVIPDQDLTNVIEYDAQSQTVSFSGTDSLLQPGFFLLKISLVDENGLKSDYTQQVVVLEPPSPELEPDQETETEMETNSEEQKTEKPVVTDSENDESVPEEKQLVVIEQVEPVPGLPNLFVPPITKVQAELVNTPVDLIPPSQLFFSIPLEARITKGVDRVKELAVRQRENLADSAADAKVGSSAPETRVGKFTNFGELNMIFTQPIKIPANA